MGQNSGGHGGGIKPIFWEGGNPPHPPSPHPLLGKMLVLEIDFELTGLAGQNATPDPAVSITPMGNKKKPATDIN